MYSYSYQCAHQTTYLIRILDLKYKLVLIKLAILLLSSGVMPVDHLLQYNSPSRSFGLQSIYRPREATTSFWQCRGVKVQATHELHMSVWLCVPGSLNRTTHILCRFIQHLLKVLSERFAFCNNFVEGNWLTHINTIIWSWINMTKLAKFYWETVNLKQTRNLLAWA